MWSVWKVVQPPHLSPHLLKEIEWNASWRRWWVTHTGRECCPCGPGFTLPPLGSDVTCSPPGAGCRGAAQPDACQLGFWVSTWNLQKKKVAISLCDHAFISMPLHHQWSSGRSICWLFLLVGKRWPNQAITLETKWFSANLLANHEQR